MSLLKCGVLRQVNGGHSLGLFLACFTALGACKKGESPDNPEPTLGPGGEAALELEALFLPGAGKELRWLAGDTPTSLSILFNQGMNTPIVRASACPSDETKWAKLPDNLVITHNTLTKPGELSREEGTMDWVSVPEITPVTAVSYSRNSKSSNADFGIQYLTAVQVDAGFDAKRDNLSLVVADIAKTVELKANACVLQNLCSEKSEGGEYIDAVYYGSMLRLYVDSGAFDVGLDAKGDAGVVKVRFKAGLTNTDLQLTGGLIGSYAGDQVAKFVSMTDVLAAIEKRDLFALQRVMHSATALGIVAVRVAQYSKSDCAALHKPAQAKDPQQTSEPGGAQ